MKITKAGGESHVLADGQSEPDSIAVDTENVYWTTSEATSGGVKRVRLGGGTTETLLSMHAYFPDMAVDATGIFLPEYDSGALLKLPLDGGTADVIASGQPSPNGIAIAGGNIYWTNGVAAGTVMTVPLGGGTARTLASGQSHPGSVAQDGDDVYWANYVGGQIVMAPLAGGAAITLVTGQKFPKALRVQDGCLYWTTFDDGQDGTVMQLRL